MKKVIVIVGPTSVGKTKLSVMLAKELNTEIISGDSMQIYKGMDIGTAKVTNDEKDGVIHHLIDIKEPDENYSVFEYQKNVRNLIDQINDKGMVPVIVGGTGLYIKSVLYDYDFIKENHNINIEDKYKDLSNEELHEYLKDIDKKSSESIHMNNRRRVLRAVAFYEKNGYPISENVIQQEHKLIYDTYLIGLTLERDILYERINNRVDIMINNGLVEEVRTLYNKGYKRELQSIQAIGYKELYDYLDNRLSLLDATNNIKQASRRYAKRQYTWFNNQFDLNWYEVNIENFNETYNEVLQDVKEFL